MSIAHFLGDDIIDAHDDDQVMNELDHYISTKLPPCDNPFEWWKSFGAQTFPRLFRIAKKYMCIQATSVPAERAFSTAGLTITKHRASLNSETADQIIFLNKNLKPKTALLRSKTSAKAQE